MSTIFCQRRLGIFDGAMGTMLHSLGLSPGECPEEWNIIKPYIITDIHNSFIDAGADVIQTNTFGGNRIKLSKYNLGNNVENINRAAVINAKNAAVSGAKVALSVGPTGKILEPWGQFSFDEAVAVFTEQICAALLEAPDLIIIETMTQLAEARAALLAARSLTDIPIVTTMAFENNGRTTFGTSPKAAGITLRAMGADLAGVNCVGDIGVISGIVKEMSSALGMPVIAQPNAGNPHFRGGQTFFPSTPETFATDCEKLSDLGAGFLGGCCGTTPEHIKALAQKIKSKHYKGTFEDQKTAAGSYFDVVFFEPEELGAILGKTDVKLHGKKISRDDLSLFIKDAKAQIVKGAKIAHVDISSFEEGDEELARQLVLSLQKNLRSGICFDVKDDTVMETVLRHYHGRAVVRTPRKIAEHGKLAAIASKYGALYYEYF